MHLSDIPSFHEPMLNGNIIDHIFMVSINLCGILHYVRLHSIAMLECRPSTVMYCVGIRNDGGRGNVVIT